MTASPEFIVMWLCVYSIQVEILSHHGAEHYCPISIFKVFGISEIDLISGTQHEVSSVLIQYT